ncbi:thermospermine synthase ACAULIS5 isoform X2 [Arachis duranensis]|uniref:Thermospermine synthase ACAULIS5 isoform X2 n=1 Tax=Arachis duranensis TaxID=130453 RepID=A0A9C6TZ10_ARADU|nr:thermospermine synthase ACAULIS5 isoform X2 [Arachis duranensis]
MLKWLSAVVSDRKGSIAILCSIIWKAGPAGIFSHTEVFSSNYNTLRQVFKYVATYTAHIPSYADIWGWVMASDFSLELNVEEIYLRMRQRIKGENRYMDGKTFSSASTLSKVVHNSLDNETHVHRGSCKVHTWPWQARLINQA